MTTLASDVQRPFELGTINEVPVIAGDIIYEGAAVGDNGSGYTIKHRHFGKYDVIDPDGNTVTEEPLPKEEALAYLEELSSEAET